jgi:hypothetical protein
VPLRLLEGYLLVDGYDAYLRLLFTELPEATTVEHIEALLPFRADTQPLRPAAPE